MKKSFIIIIFLMLTASLWAQVPQKMSYQAVIRNSNDELVTNTQIGMEINIRQGSISGNIVYTETQTPTTNANGLVSIEIGGSPGFSTINWGANIYYIETRTAIVSPLTNYTITGASQLLSVPYALHAKTAESIYGGIIETDPLWIASPSFGITDSDKTHWNSAYGWGNHASAGYLTSFTETDPLWIASPSFGITNSDKTHWNSAYGWGNHANFGYLTSENQILSITDNIISISNGNSVELPETTTYIQGSNNVSVTGNGSLEEPFQIGLQNMTNSGFISGTYLDNGCTSEIILSSTDINLMNNYGINFAGDISLTFDFPSLFTDTCDLCEIGVTDIKFQLCYNGSCKDIPLKHFLIDNHAQINLPVYGVFPISGNIHTITLKLLYNNSKCKVHEYFCLSDLLYEVTIEPHIIWYEINY